MSDESEHKYIDLRGTPCPVNFIRCRLALETLEKNQCLQVDLDTGEPESMVIPGLIEEGHHVTILLRKSTCLRIRVICGGG